MFEAPVSSGPLFPAWKTPRPLWRDGLLDRGGACQNPTDLVLYEAPGASDPIFIAYQFLHMSGQSSELPIAFQFVFRKTQQPT